MLIRTADLDRGDLRLEFGVKAEKIPALTALQTDGDLRIDGPIQVTLRALRSGDLIAVKGRLTGRVEMTCARCLDPHLQSIDSDFELSYLETDGPGEGSVGSGTGETGEAERERELDAREAGLIQFKGDTIDLAQGLGEQVIMALPFKPLCDPDCLGLCSHCGANRNQATCDCDAAATDSPFAALKAWKGSKS